ncbi:MAG: hypothetical protein ABL907_13430, partial [Hyphomicrobium sp.]
MRIRFGRCGGVAEIAARMVGAGVLCGAVALSGCSGSNSGSGQPRQVAAWQPTGVERAAALPTVPGQPPASPQSFTASGQVPVVRGVYKVGKPYVINGVTYV